MLTEGSSPSRTSVSRGGPGWLNTQDSLGPSIERDSSSHRLTSALGTPRGIRSDTGAGEDDTSQLAANIATILSRSSSPAPSVHKEESDPQSRDLSASAMPIKPSSVSVAEISPLKLSTDKKAGHHGEDFISFEEVHRAPHILVSEGQARPPMTPETVTTAVQSASARSLKQSTNVSTTPNANSQDASVDIMQARENSSSSRPLRDQNSSSTGAHIRLNGPSMRKVGPVDDDWYECYNPKLGKIYYHSARRGGIHGRHPSYPHPP